MSTFPGPLEEIPYVSVDRFDNRNLFSEVFFLSHFHADHMMGLGNYEFRTLLQKKDSAFLYCSQVTALYVLSRHLKGLDHKVKHLSINKELVINVKGLDSFMTVTALPAGHCPGSIMFLFQYRGLNYLYTGDLRMKREHIMNMKALKEPDGSMKPIETLYLDTTFYDPKYSYLPSRDESLSALIELCKPWIEKGDDHVVDVRTSAFIGAEYVIIKLSEEFGQPVHVTDSSYENYSKIPEILCAVTKDEKSQLHACLPGNKLGHDLFCKNHKKLKNCKVLKVKLCALNATNFSPEKEIYWYDDRPKYQFHRLVYSSHCSHSELQGIIEVLLPKKIVPCVIPVGATMDQVLYRLKSNADHLNLRNGSDDTEVLRFSSYEGEDEVDVQPDDIKSEEQKEGSSEALLTMSKYNSKDSSDEEELLADDSVDDDELPPFRWDCFYDGRRTFGLSKKK